MNQFDIIPLQIYCPPGPERQYNRDVLAYGFARRLYQKARERRWWNCVWAWLRRQPRQLAHLNSICGEMQIRGCHAAGIRCVPIRRIIGSEGRRGDFDRWFAPLKDELKDRWQSVAIARYHGAILPPVELIQIGDDYFVRDGHHRLSVAQALGQEDIEALVTVWQVSGPLPLDTLPKWARHPAPRLQTRSAQ
jgi:hypothetical protein